MLFPPRQDTDIRTQSNAEEAPCSRGTRATRRAMRLPAALLAVGLVACGSSAPTPHAGEHETAADPHALVATGATFLDVRTEPEFEAHHLDGATLIPLDELHDRLAELPTDRPVVVYCRSGARSARAAAMLRAAGYEVHDLGSMDNW
jgi:rhodanese-related sulfurtransferase